MRGLRKWTNQQKAEVEKFFTFDRTKRLLKLLGDTYKWNRRAEEKDRSPFLNRSFASILDEHWPDQQMKVTSKNPRQNRGFCFYRMMLEFGIHSREICDRGTVST